MHKPNMQTSIKWDENLTLPLELSPDVIKSTTHWAFELSCSDCWFLVQRFNPRFTHASCCSNLHVHQIIF
jgi:hypothetical protein